MESLLRQEREEEPAGRLVSSSVGPRLPRSWNDRRPPWSRSRSRAVSIAPMWIAPTPHRVPVRASVSLTWRVGIPREAKVR